jgi:hypothetical protein
MNRAVKVIVSAVVAATTGTAVGAPLWISAPAAVQADSNHRPVALQFRREVTYSERPRVLTVQVSADNRFLLVVNGQRVGTGPARGDLRHWRYETFDIASYLKQGINVIAALVWNDAASAPFAQVSSGHTGFWLRSPDPIQSAIVESGPDWQVRVDESRTVSPGMASLRPLLGGVFYAAGPPETHRGAAQRPGWALIPKEGDDWQTATVANEGNFSPWNLVADALPPMRYALIANIRQVRASGIATKGFPGVPVTVPAHTTVSLLLDTGRVLTAYPSLRVSGGAGAQVNLTYCEALYDRDARASDPLEASRIRLADRAAVGDGVALGLTDTFEPDGADHRLFQPFWWRTWRFVQIDVKTADQPLTLVDFAAAETGYPLEQRGWFRSNDPELDAIWRTGWATARVDAHETYMDSAYWEQLQYIGDTRIQMLISYDVAGDARLAVQALDAFDSSRGEGALPESAFPNVFHQIIPPFALLWIGGLHDYWMYQTDTAVVTRNLPGARAVLDEFAHYQQPTGLVGPLPGWPFVDWVAGLDGWKDREHGTLSCIVSMQYFGALREAADLERALGDHQRAERYLSTVERVRAGLNSECWDPQRGLYANTPARTQFSQHGAALAVLYDIAPAEQQRALLGRVSIPDHGLDAPPGITSSSYYFSFYLARALAHAGMTDRYVGLLGPWREMLHRHFTTWPEKPDPSRSDTHAWSAHPTVGLTTYVAGIQPDAPGYSRVRIEPHLGALKQLDAAVVHPFGRIEVKYEVQRQTVTAQILLPPGLSGTFLWNGQASPLTPGANHFELPRADASRE